MDIHKLNFAAWKEIGEYLLLKLGNVELAVPYFSNDVGRYFGKMMREVQVPQDLIKKVFDKYNRNEIPFGWWRGKGTPDQIQNAAEELAKLHEIELQTFTTEGMREFMKMVGMGVDCSGFVYNVLSNVLGEDYLIQTLDWEGEEKNIFKAGAFTFGGRASEIIELDKLGPLDLILIKKRDLVTYSHVALVLEKDGWWVAQSTSTAIPMGVTADRFRFKDKQPIFDFRPSRGESWEELYNTGRLEFRHLRNL